MRTCPVDGCGKPIRMGMLMCLGHWRRVPKRIQHEVWATWRELRQMRSLDRLAAYRMAHDCAIDAVNGKLAAEAPHA
jgi:hypothetical protein